MARRRKAATKLALKLDNFLPFLLSIASNAVSNVVARTYQVRFGLDIPQWRSLAVLAEADGLTPQQICNRTLMDKVTVSRAAHALVSRGLAERTPHLRDGRSHVLVLTAEGQRLVKDVAPAALAMEEMLFEAFTAKETAQFAGFLNRVRVRAAVLGEVSDAE